MPEYVLRLVVFQSSHPYAALKTQSATLPRPSPLAWFVSFIFICVFTVDLTHLFSRARALTCRSYGLAAPTPLMCAPCRT
jgi:hypothetical protein